MMEAVVERKIAEAVVECKVVATEGSPAKPLNTSTRNRRCGHHATTRHQAHTSSMHHHGSRTTSWRCNARCPETTASPKATTTSEATTTSKATATSATVATATAAVSRHGG